MDRVVMLLVCAAFLTGCSSMPAIQTYDHPVTAETQPAAKRVSLHASKPAPKAPHTPTVAVTTAAEKAKTDAPSPQVGSPEWDKLQAENERKEQRLKQTIQNICRGC